MQTKAQKIIRRYERQVRRTQKQTWNDMRALLGIVRVGDDIYRDAMGAISTLRRLGRKTQENAFMWKPADATVQRLLQIAKGGKTKWQTPRKQQNPPT